MFIRETAAVQVPSSYKQAQGRRNAFCGSHLHNPQQVKLCPQIKEIKSASLAQRVLAIERTTPNIQCHINIIIE